MGSLATKIYARILEARLSSWAEASGVRASGQAGFRRDHCATNNVILRTVLDLHRAADKRPILRCFVDFKKAYDTVPRARLWYPQRSAVVATFRLRMVREMGVRGREAQEALLPTNTNTRDVAL